MIPLGTVQKKTVLTEVPAEMAAMELLAERFVLSAALRLMRMLAKQILMPNPLVPKVLQHITKTGSIILFMPVLPAGELPAQADKLRSMV